MILKNKNGFTLVEVMVSTCIIAVLILGVYSLLIYTLQVTADNKLRVGAIMLADKKMEYIRNLPYNSVGTVGGMIHGNIPDNETVAQNNVRFNVNILVQYKDDPYDGTEDGSPDDTRSNDYKIVTIKVEWHGPLGAKNITTFSKIAPKGMEGDLGGGTLSILVHDSVMNPVKNATVTIINNLLATPINFSAQTSEFGRLNFPGAPVSDAGYEITVTKTGYSTSSTTAKTIENPNPTLINASVMQGKKTEVAYEIDLVSDLIIKAVTANTPQNWQINTDNSHESQNNSRLAIDASGNIYIVWQDYRSASASKIYAQKYNSSGNAQWPNPGAPADVNIAPANNTVIPDILVDSAGNLYISWHDDSAGNKEAYLVKRNSADGSDVWGAEKKVNTLADAANQSYPRIAIADNGTLATTTIVWQDDRNGDDDVYMQQFNVAGTKQWSPEKRVNSNAIGDSTNQTEPAIAVDSLYNIIVVWADNRNGNLDVYAEKFDQGGNMIWGDKKINNDPTGTANQYQPDIAIDSANNIYIVWTDERGGDKDVYAQGLNANGAILWTNDYLINESSDSTQYSPSIAVNPSNNIYIVWTDERNGNKDIYAQKFDTSYNKQWTNDVRVNVNLGASEQYNPDLAISPATGEPYASWDDNRQGDFDIFATKFDVYGAETPVANVPVNVVGMKQIGENPIIFKFNKSYITGSGGRVDLTAIEKDSYTMSLLAGYTTHHLLMTNPIMPLDLPANSLREIILYLD